MRNYITYDWFTLFTLLGLVLIVAAKYVNALRFNDFLYITGNIKYLKIYTKDKKKIDRFDGLLFINLALSASIFIFFVYSTFISPLTFELPSFLKLVGSVAALLITKTLFERLIGRLFEIDDIITHYLFQKTTFKNFSGMVFLIANLFLLYAIKYAEIVIMTTIILICLTNLIGFLSSYKKNQKLINANFIYFLLYLCTLEIGPYVLLYKAIK